MRQRKWNSFHQNYYVFEGPLCVCVCDEYSFKIQCCLLYTFLSDETSHTVRQIFHFYSKNIVLKKIIILD